jgi:hypothetical protein
MVVTHILRVGSIACFLVPGSAWRGLADAKITFLDVGSGRRHGSLDRSASGRALLNVVAGMETVISRKTNRLSQDPDD